MNLLRFWKKLAEPPAIDPTDGWPTSDGTVPVVDIGNGLVGGMAFGSPLQNARLFGKPFTCRRGADGYLALLYTHVGFQLDYEKGRLAYAAYFLAPDPFQPVIQDLRFCEPQLSNGVGLSGETTRNRLEQLFGAPSSIDNEDADDVILNYGVKGVIHEFELNAGNKLKRWNLYPETEIVL
jgi:hypothetical protein